MTNKAAKRSVTEARQAKEPGAITNLDAQRQTEEILRQTREELARSIAERTELLHRIVNAQEDERRRISRELHDQLGQRLAALRLSLRVLERSLRDRPEELERLRQILEISDQIGHDVEHLAAALRTAAVDDLGLRAVLEQYIREWSELSRIPVEFRCREIDRRRFPDNLEITLYRVIQEALTNILRHASATSVCLILDQQPNNLHAIIEDNGCGFDVAAIQNAPNRCRLGILSMEERVALLGGGLTVESTPGNGTTIFISIPLPQA
ncbi:MAG TPA: sensor histidine kinase [Blastocatellia bacterium]|nr:sensor histidine kinase [Blastocatellia bacterium]